MLYFSAVRRAVRRIHLTSVRTWPQIIKMPSLSPTMEDGGIVAWHKKEGDTVEAGDLLCEVQTDKAVVAYDADDDGVLAKIFKSDGATGIKVGTQIAVMALPDEDWKTVAAEAKEEVEAAPETASSTPAKVAEATPTPLSNTHLIGPAVKLLLSKHKLSADQLTATGPHNILLKGDVLEYLKQEPATHKTSPFSTAPYVDIPLSGMRKTIAKRLGTSKSSIPHQYTRYTFNADNLNKLRARIKRQGSAPSVNDFVVKACGLALRYVSEINGVSSSDESHQLLPNIDICVAVATPSGLITPIVKDADKRSVTDISSDIKSLAKRAKANELKPHEFQGGTFTISNLGMFGIREFTAIINLPQLAILAVGGGSDCLHPDTESPSQKVTITLSSDARFVDQVEAGRFVKIVGELLERDPQLLLDGDKIQLSVSKDPFSTIQLNM